MELEPVGGPGRGRAARARSWLAVLLPVVVLGSVAGGGVLGQSRSASPETEPGTVVAASGSTRTEPPASAQPRPRATVPPAPLRQTGVPLPGRILGLEVEDVADARDSPRRSRPNELVAIRGWLTMAPSTPGCDARWHLACRLEGRLSAARSPDGASLRLETQPGVLLLGLQRQDPRPGTWSVPNQAIVVGRFTRPLYRECGIPSPDCEPRFTIERLAWVRRSARERPVAFGPGASRAVWETRGAETAGREALAAGHREVGETLVVALIDGATLGLVDPIAAAATDAEPDAALWYLRAVVWQGTDAIVAWAVVDDAERRVLATGA